MDRRASCQTTSRRAVMGSTLRHLLLLLLLCASPASFTLLEEIDALTETPPLDQTTDLLRFLRSLVAYSHLKEAVSSDLKSVEADKQQAASKRGFGIAGLDNVDMITSTLDRSRSRSRYRPQMSMNVNLSQLRALMAKAG